MDEDVGRQLLQRAQVMPKRLLDQMSLLDPGRTDVTLEQLFGGR
jgi:hypothetical protein